MRAVSAAWLRTVRGSFTPVYQAVLCRDYQTGLSPQGEQLPILGGGVDLDGRAALYTRGTVTVPAGLWPKNVRNTDSLAPYGTEVYMRAGIAYSDALVEWVGYGYLRIRSLHQDNESGSPVLLTLEDRNASIARARLLAPKRFGPSTTNGEMVSWLVRGALPEATIEWADEGLRDTPIGRDVIIPSDRLGGIQSVMQANGQLARWDSSGVLRVFPVPSPFTAPAATIASGRGGVLVWASRDLTDEEVVNAVVARGDATVGGDGPYGVAVDDATDSPTRYSGRFGPSVKEIANSLITSNSQATNAALAELTQRAGLLHSLDLAFSPRFELEPDDSVAVLGAEEQGTHFLASLSVPFVSGRHMTGQTRQKSVGFGSQVVTV